MRLRKLNNNQPQTQIIYQPRVLSLECHKEEITAILEDGRKLTIPTA